jgi:hypothetical protein
MRLRLLRLALVATGCCEVAACTPPPDYLFVDPQVRPVRVELRKSFGLLEKHYAPVAITECDFAEESPPQEGGVRWYNDEVWRVVATAPGTGVLQLRYGEVPPGFVQSTPAVGPPPPLKPGRRYKVECSGDTIGMGEFVAPGAVTQPPQSR